MAVQIFNPLNYPDWDKWIEAHPLGHLFLTSAWASVLASAYSYRPTYLGCRNQEGLTCLLPFMQIHSVITGKRGVSLPFTDLCPPLADSKAQLRQMIRNAISLATRQRWRTLSLRMDQALPLSVDPSRCYKRHILPLSGSLEGIKRRIRKSTLRNARRAEKAAVRIERSHDIRAMEFFYKLNCITRKRHGLPPQPWRFFKAVHRHIIAAQKGVLFIGFLEQHPIAAAVFFHYKKDAYYKYGASDLTYSTYRPNNLIMWQAIRHYNGLGYRLLDFGRTEYENAGLLQFKRGWGTKEETIYYYNYNAKKKKFTTPSLRIRSGYRVFRRLPIPALRWIGQILYPHVG